MLNNNVIDNLLALLNIESYSGNEKPVADALVPFLVELGFDIMTDEVGNVYAKRGEVDKYPMLNAHMDSVKGYSYSYGSSYNRGTSYSAVKKRSCKWCDDAIDCYQKHYYSLGEEYNQFSCEWHKELKHINYEPKEVVVEKEEEKVATNKPVASIKGDSIVGDGSRPIGGDDKCGIAMALQIAIDYPLMPLKLFFSVGEEIGCVGVKHAVKENYDFFTDVMYSITLDRRGNSDICIKSCSGVNGRLAFFRQLSDAFFSAKILPTFVDGSSADVVYLREIVYDCVNMSVGYESPHTNSETVSIPNFNKLYLALSTFVTSYVPHSEEMIKPMVVTPILPPVVVTTKPDTSSSYTSDWYFKPEILKRRNKLRKLIKKLRSENWKGCKMVFGLDVQYEGVVSILEIMPPVEYERECKVKLKNEMTGKYAYMAINADGLIYFVVPTAAEMKDVMWIEGDNLGINFMGLF